MRILPAALTPGPAAVRIVRPAPPTPRPARDGMPLPALALLAQLALPGQATPPRGAPAPRVPRAVAPTLAFPEPGLDDTAAYQGYRTRLFRDAAGNTVQLYVEGRDGRLVHLWADAENEALALTARGADGRPAPLRWGGPDAVVDARGRTRTLEYRLVAGAPAVRLGGFLLGSMRVERDYQAAGRQRAPFDTVPFAIAEVDRLLAALARLAPDERAAHLRLLGARDLAALRARATPVVTLAGAGAPVSKAVGAAGGAAGGAWVARVVQPSLDGRDTLALEIVGDPRRVAVTRAGTGAGTTLALRALAGDSVPVTVRIATTGRALAALDRREIFTDAFLALVADEQRAADAPGADPAAVLRARRLERQVRGVELLASREKLMAGLPTYATYFGRDMLVTALMMRPIWRGEVSEFVVGAVLRKLAPDGQVSHEEALGGQAAREAAAEYAALVDSALGTPDAGARRARLARAGTVLAALRRPRENYHMVDDEFQFPVVAARWLADPTVPDARKRAFLLAPADAEGGADARLTRLLRALALVARLSAPYAADPRAPNLVAFPERREGGRAVGYESASWRDSRAGYAGGRWAMDVNAVWVPHALESLGILVRRARALGLPVDSLAGALPELAPATPMGRYLRDPGALDAAVATWRGAARHFVVRLGPDSVRARVAARLAAMPAADRAAWERVRDAAGAGAAAGADSLTFLAVALDADARPIGVANSDVATRLFLGEREADAAVGGAPAGGIVADTGAVRDAVLRDVRLFVRPYPVGLLVERVGPAVANDAYAPPPVWEAFVRDPYHGPRVVWGREVNLFLLGAADRIAAAPAGPGRDAYVAELRAAMARVAAAVEASGFHSELWSYEVIDGRPTAVRYGTGADVQLWSTTDLAVRWAMERLAR